MADGDDFADEYHVGFTHGMLVGALCGAVIIGSILLLWFHPFG